MRREGRLEQVGASARLLRNAEKPDETAVSPSAASIRLPNTIHQKSLKNKFGVFKSLPQDQTADATLATPTPATTGQYSSRARQSRHRRQLETRPDGRAATSGPPKGQVVVSPARPSSIEEPPAGDAFSDVPGVEGTPSEAPTFTTTQQQRAENSKTPLTSLPKSPELPGESGPKDSAPTLLEALSEDAQSQSPPSQEGRRRRAMAAARAAAGRVNFVQFWTLTIVAAATLGLPLGLLILSYLATPKQDFSSVTARHTRLHTAISHPGTTKATPVPWNTLASRPMSTDPWAGVPPTCRQRPRVSDDTHLVTAQGPLKLQSPTRRNIFCLFNVTRFHRGGGLDFLPHNLPFTHCPNVVYWSFGIADGLLYSRTPSFEKEYGLDKLRDTANSSGAPYVKILLAVGGYSEENSQFTLLDRDAGAMSRFVRAAMRLVKTNLLDGLAVHWREAVPGCESGTMRDAFALHAAFQAVRTVFQLNGFPGLLALIVPTQVSSTDAIIDRVVDVVDYVFLEVRQVRPLSNQITYTFCGLLAKKIMEIIERSPGYDGNEAKFCPVFSVAPWLVDAVPGFTGSTVPLLSRLSNTSQSGGEPGAGSALNMRGPPDPCQLPSPAADNNDACLALTSSATASRPFVYMFHTDATLWSIFQGSPSNSSVRCALLVDLELDNYVMQAGSNLPDYWLIQYVYWVLERKGPEFVRMSMRDC